MNKLFQDELNYLKDVGREFSKLNPKLAKYLSEESTDPDVERMMEGFAFLTSGIRGKIEDEMPEFTHSMISIVWPNFLRVFPSTTMMKLTPIDRSITERQIVAKATEVLSNPVDGVPCRFVTTSDCAVYPLEIAGLRLEKSRDNARIRIAFKTLSGLPLGQINLTDLRLTFTGDATTSQVLHLWTGRYLKAIKIVFGEDDLRSLPPDSHFYPIGMSAGEAILPQPRTAFEGHRLLQEYFVFPAKFYGYDLLKLGPVFAGRAESEFEIELEFERSLPADIRLRPDAIQLYCVPAVNLFLTGADPLLIDHRKTAYRIRPQDQETGQLEVFSIDHCTSHITSGRDERISSGRTYPAFESFNHEVGEGPHGEQIYYRHRAKKSLSHDGFEYEISFVLHNSREAVPVEESLSVDLTCFNRNICAELAIGEIRTAPKSAATFVEYTNVTRPTVPVYPPLDGTLNWNLIANLSLNYMSLLDRDAIAAILSTYDYRSLYDRQAERAARQRLEGILTLTTQPVDRLFKGMPIRGLKTKMTMRESCFQSEGEMYLFASILAEFFALYATVNSFHQLEARGEEHGEIYTWQPRIGRQPLI
ncbi:type VI secretion system baseplate subunit TssF [Neorhizobium sp. T786]|uniref:type VI secretion system baseplate subunit TssF n=1 Tax=Pseudorhizobium xiangyangii TaxID=2883104 RepID=UPI001CFF8C84|nr:type VI secretion system baseplate subunit TssF [Neorhizobium xiangyangii]MCB5205264.1 type VI secretion system baseplate subunit TssF [Neorhizobium xiangyangii]